MEPKLEYLAAALRQHIQSLNYVIEEMEHEHLSQEALSWRIRAIEIGLRRLREAA
jgi:hypothetical protein